MTFLWSHCPEGRGKGVPGRGSPSHLQMGSRRQQMGLEAQVWAVGRGSPGEAGVGGGGTRSERRGCGE